VGDSAGLVDPLTGEGLYYAIRSADLAAHALLAEVGDLAAKLVHYRALLRHDFAADLEFGAHLAKRFFVGRILCGAVTERMVEFTRRSPRFSLIMQDLFAGRQPYASLKRRLLRNLNGSLYDLAMSLGFARVVPGRSPHWLL
jgi:flavin-dependent dehydrogenase